MELPPDQNNNPHLRAQLKRDRDANERFEAGDGTAKAARIRTVEIGTLTAEELEERKGRAQYEARGGQPLQRPRRASDDTYSLVYFNADSSSVMDTLMSGVQRSIPGERYGDPGMSYNERFSERYDEMYHSDPVIRKGGAECVIS